MHPKKNCCITFWGGWKYRGLETNAMTLRHTDDTSYKHTCNVCCHCTICLSKNGVELVSFQNIDAVVSSDIRHAALQRHAKVLRMVSNTRIIGHNQRQVTRNEHKNSQHLILEYKLSGKTICSENILKYVLSTF